VRQGQWCSDDDDDDDDDNDDGDDDDDDEEDQKNKSVCVCVGGGVVFLETLFSFDNDDGDILNNVDNRFSPTSTKTVPKLSIAGNTKCFYFNCSEEKTQSEFGQ